MSNALADHIVAMFVDVAGSTQLYETLGDTAAHECIAASLKRIIYHSKQYHGQLIETIGDEALLTFDRVQDAIAAAMSMQNHFFQQPVVASHYMRIRIGFHFGSIEYDDTGHPFGDTINVAARVVALCDASRIIATKSTLNRVRDKFNGIIRHYQRARVKGKSEPLLVEEVVWAQNDATSLHDPQTQTFNTQFPQKQLTLRYHNGRMILQQDQSPFLIGRDPETHLQIDSALVSRSHARIEFRWGEIILTDHSTNGTYLDAVANDVTFANPIRLHRRETILAGEGVIGVGASVENASPNCVIQFKVEPLIQSG